MAEYVARRAGLAVVTLLLLSVLVSGVVRLIPGDAVMAKIAEAGFADPTQIPALRHELGLDRSFPEQYGSWILGALHGDFGDSFQKHRPVFGEFADALPVTLELAALAFITSLLIAVPLGVLSAIRPNTPWDLGGRLFAVCGLAMPDFFVALTVIIVLSRFFNYTTPIGYVSPTDDLWKNLQQFVFPAAILGFRMSAVTMRMLRSSLLEVMRQDYVRTAWAKGLREQVVVTRHALKNAMLPVVTIVGNQAAYLFGGAVILEQIFALPGVGWLTLSAIEMRDYPQIQMNVLFFGVVIVGMNLLVDLSYGWLDPRIKLAT
ncbi:MAG: ABC transporter permease [Thermoflexaceae bacterium]|nr:ABC transporter permease [Thermoflexaceae bacterium]